MSQSEVPPRRFSPYIFTFSLIFHFLFFSLPYPTQKTKTNQKEFLSCLVGIEVIQENFCPTTPTASHSQSSLFFDGCD